MPKRLQVVVHVIGHDEENVGAIRSLVLSAVTRGEEEQAHDNDDSDGVPSRFSQRPSGNHVPIGCRVSTHP